ncbi:hypothetical protein CBL_01343 [Carabus blaptoides fortunei]
MSDNGGTSFENGNLMHRHYEPHKVTQRVHTQQTNRNIKYKCVLIERSVKRDGRNEKSDFSTKCGTKWSPVNACGVYQVADDSKFAYQPPLEESAVTVTREEVLSKPRDEWFVGPSTDIGQIDYPYSLVPLPVIRSSSASIKHERYTTSQGDGTQMPIVVTSWIKCVRGVTTLCRGDDVDADERFGVNFRATEPNYSQITRDYEDTMIKHRALIHAKPGQT